MINSGKIKWLLEGSGAMNEMVLSSIGVRQAGVPAEVRDVKIVVSKGPSPEEDEINTRSYVHLYPSDEAFVYYAIPGGDYESPHSKVDEEK